MSIKKLAKYIFTRKRKSYINRVKIWSIWVKKLRYALKSRLNRNKLPNLITLLPTLCVHLDDEVEVKQNNHFFFGLVSSLPRFELQHGTKNKVKLL